MYLSGQHVILIDGHSLFHRAFFALPHLTNGQGQPTNAVYGFLTMLLKLIEVYRPDCIVTALDRSTPTFRHATYEGYKAHRPEMADELRSQFPYLRQALAAMRVPVYELDGYEADDIIGGLALRAAGQGCRVTIVTGDRDLLQLVGPRIKVLLTRRGISEMEEYDVEAVMARYGLKPVQLRDVKALMGDPSDNIPGVPGIGEKTALKLIKEYGSIEGFFERAGPAGGRAVSTALQLKEQVEMSKHLATIDTDTPVVFDLEECKYVGPDMASMAELCSRLDFHSLARRLGINCGEAGGEAASDSAGLVTLNGRALQPEDVKVIVTNEEAQVTVNEILEGGPESEPLSLLPVLELVPGRPGEFSLSSVVIAYNNGLRILRDQGLQQLGPLMASGRGKGGHDLKPLVRHLLAQGNEVKGLESDTAIAAYLVDPLRSGYPLESVAEKYLGVTVEKARDGAVGDDALAVRASWLEPLRDRLNAEIDRLGLKGLYHEVEMPLMRVLAQMEATGITVDEGVLDQLGEEFSRRLDELATNIYDLAGVEFNINSTQQLAEVLFKKLNLPPVRKTKTGYSTDASVLEELAASHPIAGYILEHRQLAKLKGTYIEGLKPLINPETGRVYTTFNQTVTATGRLSSTDPNLQNIPVRDEMGRRIRRAFIAAPGHVLIGADYSQIELRILAHVSEDPGLISAFLEGADIHQATAAEVFGVPRDQVTPAMRSRAKAVNFGIVYGISDFGLSQNLGISRKEAKEYIENYFRRYPGVSRYCEGIVREARREGLVRTIMGRIRHLPEINSKNFARRQFAERTALNTPIQGSAADIIKKAMVDVYRELQSAAPRSRLILQVHDELILEAPEEEAEAAKRLLVEYMERAVELAVPLKVDVRTGQNWYEMR